MDNPPDDARNLASVGVLDEPYVHDDGTIRAMRPYPIVQGLIAFAYMLYQRRE